jgi:hypothetical protein
MAIDTADLSDKTHDAIMIEAENFDHNLTLQFGLLSYECSDEIDFIKKSKALINELLSYDNEDINDVFFGEPPTRQAFHKALNKILKNIEEL